MAEKVGLKLLKIWKRAEMWERLCLNLKIVMMPSYVNDKVSTVTTDLLSMINLGCIMEDVLSMERKRRERAILNAYCIAHTLLHKVFGILLISITRKG